MDNFNDIWLMIRESLRDEINTVMYSVYISDELAFDRFENNTVFLRTDKDFKMRVLNFKLKEPIKQKFEEALGYPVEVEFFNGSEDNESDDAF